MASKLDALLGKLDRVKPCGSGKWLACCPAHEDRSPSLSVKLTDDSKILVHCFAGCHVSDVVAAVGLELVDLMPDQVGFGKRTKSPRFFKGELFDRLVFESLILLVAVRQLQGGEVLSVDDNTRIDQAMDTIDNLAREVSRGRS